jgi:biopolymer transport protein TolR
MDIGGKGVRSDINVTPLVDVVLVLLIIFMVVTPLLQRGKSVQLPEARLLSDLGQGDAILLSVTRDKRIWLDRAEVRREGLAEALAAEMAKSPRSPIMLKADRELDYRTVREVILEVSRTHAPGVSLAASELSDQVGR